MTGRNFDKAHEEYDLEREVNYYPDEDEELEDEETEDDEE